MSNSYSLKCSNLTLLTLSAIMLQIVGLSLFITGFFPVKPTLSGTSGLESFYPPGADPIDFTQDIAALTPDKLKSLYQELAGIPPLFDRLVLMVIDGLPAEFVLGRNGNPPPKVFAKAMPYTHSLLDRGHAIGYHAKAAPPTVTMPRIKAMVSGAIGGFLDVAFNFNTQAFFDDNLIGKFLSIGWKMVMLGDETWIKLFPKAFFRHDGVSSFFVKDTIEVDYNVSRHLIHELNRTDWDLMILHYLGLDHVGHIGGRSCILMGPKMTEMDEVIRMIHSSFSQTQEINPKRTLLMILSDHGMTEGGNHGGSSYEETDALAIFVSAQKLSEVAQTNNKAYQVDIAATLSLLFGVPIPKNNVGTVMAEIFSSFEDEQHLRLLELNSWQLLRLLEAHMPKPGCGRFSCGRNDDASKFCCSYLDATTLHESWRLKNSSRYIVGDDYRSIVLAYNDFLRNASQWLSSRATDKPIGLLASGIAAMLVSCLGLLTLLFLLSQEVHFKGRKYLSHADKNVQNWHLDEYFTVAIIFILMLSMGSSSMVEEEHYIWYSMTSSLYLLLLRKTIQSISNEQQKITSYRQIYSIVAVLISGRILRGWHQGGVNWSYLPDISKFLDKGGVVYVKSLQYASIFLVTILSIAFLFSSLRLRRRLALVLMIIYISPVWLILKQMFKYRDTVSSSSSVGDSSTSVQLIYSVLGISTAGILVATPWFMPLLRSDGSSENQSKISFRGFNDCVRVIGWCYVFSWCLLQLLLQQPVNSVPVSLLLLQILGSILFFSDGDSIKGWVKVAALYYIGMSGHFSLGNTNTLATIDVAGAFIGVSSHSTMISGILMFIITYASPILALLSIMLMDVSVNTTFGDGDGDYGHLLKMSIGYPCLVPLGINSILLLAYTIVLIFMRNHLFVWSVFSPKYLYVCATTVSVYIGVTILALTTTYTSIAFTIRGMLKDYCCRNN